ncbi:beta-galactosidase [Streptomyces sp. NPDC059740]|uniref:beta-galactosidase n=1 Tax=Streptomyces sp. NPDC059740 TaxID=3346926 RepID=UPI003648E4BA
MVGGGGGGGARFAVGERGFALDGEPVRLLSGALHYFRVHEAQWGHRLAMVRAMGLNCVETYVPWNLHEPSPGRYRDVAALGRFLDAVAGAGLWALVRPGPYICAEWENGGLPHWVTGPLGRRVRTRDAEWLRLLDGWFERLLPQVVERQVSRGGPVLMVQVENEYGSWGSDRVYLEHLAARLRGLGVEVPLFTSDGPEDHMLSGGSVPGVLATANFGAGAREAFEVVRRHRSVGPLMCMEFWCGWFSHWAAADGTVEPVVRREAADAAGALAQVLECGASVNVYMAHGGTNFAGWAGANRAGALHDGALEPTVTSYDYDAPIDERGRVTEKFRLFREVLAGYAAGPLPPVPAAEPVLERPVPVELTQWVAAPELLAGLGGPEVVSGVAPAFEELDVDRGVVRYRFEVPGPRQPYPLRAVGLRDRAVVYVDGVRRGVVEGEDVLLGEVAGPAVVELWVSSLGRVNYGPRTGEAKGLTGGLLHERQYLHGVRSRGLRLDAWEDAAAVARLPWRALPDAGEEVPGGPGPAGLFRGVCEVAGAGDAALELPGWEHGFAWVNGFCVGRYRAVGPQVSLYVPGPVVREGRNEVWLWELEGSPPPAGVGAAAGAVRLVP